MISSEMDYIVHTSTFQIGRHVVFSMLPLFLALLEVVLYSLPPWVRSFRSRCRLWILVLHSSFSFGISKSSRCKIWGTWVIPAVRLRVFVCVVRWCHWIGVLSFYPWGSFWPIPVPQVVYEAFVMYIVERARYVHEDRRAYFSFFPRCIYALWQDDCIFCGSSWSASKMMCWEQLVCFR